MSTKTKETCVRCGEQLKPFEYLLCDRCLKAFYELVLHGKEGDG